MQKTQINKNAGLQSDILNTAVDTKEAPAFPFSYTQRI